ncbi:MAG: hypothetical protein HQL60_09165 [Magnetococcales bacterium]|nr:hypothetical protein [Magnetococcales bacterium]
MARHLGVSESLIRCPVCAGRPAHIYRCNHCGEVRCGQEKCYGSESAVVGWASSGSRCRHCGLGHYRVIDSAGAELADFVREYRLEQRVRPLRQMLHESLLARQRDTFACMPSSSAKTIRPSR